MIGNRFSLRGVSSLLLALGVLVAAGCASKTEKVNITGKVTYKGEAVGWGNVRFFNSKGELYSAAPLNPDGTFVATDVPQGEVQVALQQLPAPPGAGKMKGGPSAPGGEADEGIVVPSKIVKIPSKYQDPKTSGLHFTIGPGENKLNIELQ